MQSDPAEQISSWTMARGNMQLYVIKDYIILIGKEK